GDVGLLPGHEDIRIADADGDIAVVPCNLRRPPVARLIGYRKVAELHAPAVVVAGVAVGDVPEDPPPPGPFEIHQDRLGYLDRGRVDDADLGVECPDDLRHRRRGEA